MENDKNYYVNPLQERYASHEMLSLFSPNNKFVTWRKLWIALAEAQKELGIDISEAQIQEMKEHEEDIDYEYVAELEEKFRHDVMAHVHAYSKLCPKARPIIHLGATSAYVGDNTDLIVMRDALILIRTKMVRLLNHMQKFALQYKDLPTLGFTHFQPAQLTTVGKRCAMWMQDIVLDFHDLEHAIKQLSFRGVKGTTGTQASFLNLFHNDDAKVVELDNMVAKKFNFDNVLTITGQTYTRKQDSRVLKVLSGIAESAHKIANDIRLLANLKEIEEPFGTNQIGSSAMAYKRNPMKSERVCSIARFVITTALNGNLTHSTQWFERTLDDSANRRIAIPESFLGIDGVLDILCNIFAGLTVYEGMIHKRINDELPFMATENIIMQAVKKGADRQDIHEAIRQHSMEAAQNVKVYGQSNNLLELIAQDESIPLDEEDIADILKPQQFTGRASNQTSFFIIAEIMPIINRFKSSISADTALKV